MDDAASEKKSVLTEEQESVAGSESTAQEQDNEDGAADLAESVTQETAEQNAESNEGSEAHSDVHEEGIAEADEAKTVESESQADQGDEVDAEQVKSNEGSEGQGGAGNAEETAKSESEAGSNEDENVASEGASEKGEKNNALQDENESIQSSGHSQSKGQSNNEKSHGKAEKSSTRSSASSRSKSKTVASSNVSESNDDIESSQYPDGNNANVSESKNEHIKAPHVGDIESDTVSVAAADKVGTSVVQSIASGVSPTGTRKSKHTNGPKPETHDHEPTGEHNGEWEVSPGLKKQSTKNYVDKRDRSITRTTYITDKAIRIINLNEDELSLKIRIDAKNISKSPKSPNKAAKTTGDHRNPCDDNNSWAPGPDMDGSVTSSDSGQDVAGNQKKPAPFGCMDASKMTEKCTPLGCWKPFVPSGSDDDNYMPRKKQERSRASRLAHSHEDKKNASG